VNIFKYCDKGAIGAIVIIRLVLGIIFLVHGADKVGSLSETVERMSMGLGISPIMAFLVCAIEFLGGLGLILGLFTRFAAAGIAIVMIGAVITIHAQHGFFLQNHGYEYNLALLGMCVALILAGGGPWSIDSKFAAWTETKLQRHSYQERLTNETKT
jgi:putative oxidoreductase